MGTAMTGRMVSAAMTPARWAAPPAPAMMTRMPRAAASRLNSLVRAGERWAEQMSISWGMSKRSRALAASFMMSRSLSLPMMMETTGLVSIG